MGAIAENVELARQGANEKLISRLSSGWAVMGDVQFLPGYCLLLPDPVVGSLNDLDDAARVAYLRDMARLGDALLQVTDAERINYEILGNSAPELHAHVFPRYATEPAELRRGPVWFYDWEAAPPYDPETHPPLLEALRNALEQGDVGAT
ncbi:MAG TPA: HIT domain-containing protein [Candidatus Limnocylindria bacterium]